MLEFASGYGCVTRHFKKTLPEAAITSCDIHEEAMKFIARNFKADTVLSASRPEDLNVKKEYDIVFALSFFSHMPKATWTRWYNFLLSKVKPGGHLIFTTQGWMSRKYFGFPAYDEAGFWFRPDSEQKDLDTSEYGATLVHPFFVFREAARNPSGISYVFGKDIDGNTRTCML